MRNPALLAASRRGRRRVLGSLAVIPLGVALAAAGASAAGAANVAAPALAPVADGAASGGNVIVVLKAQHADLNLRTQGTARQAADFADQAPIVVSIKASGGTGITQLVAVSAVAAHVSAAEVAALRANEAVARIVPDASGPAQTGGSAGSAAAPASVAKKSPGGKAICPGIPGEPGKPAQEPEALADIHASNGNQSAPDEANSIATGKGVIVAIPGMNNLAGNPNFQRPDGQHVVIDAPSYTADAGNDESYGDASSVAAQGTVVYSYAKALPYSDVPADCEFTIKGDAPDASLVDSSQIDTPPSSNLDDATQTDTADQAGANEMTESALVSDIDNAVITEHADVISESYGGAEARVPAIVHTANDAAVAAGVTVVVSSGDSGSSGTMNPISADPEVIAAGAVDQLRLVAMAHDYSGYVSNNMAAISSGGTAPTNKVVNLVAPGYLGEAACADNSGGCPPDYPTESFRGTSEAAPLTAGAAADVIQAYRNTHDGASPTPAQVKDVLTSTATDINSPADQQGAGLLNVYAAVKAAQELPGTTLGRQAGYPALVASADGQLNLTGNGGSTQRQDVSLYNTSGSPVVVTGNYRVIGPERQIGRVVTEQVSAPDPSLPVPPEGAQAAEPIKFNVPPGLDHLDADMIWPDPTNDNIICFALFDPRGRLEQLSYDDGSPGQNGAVGTVSDDQDAQVTDPMPGRWTAKILWSGKDVDLALPPAVPGTYTGPVSFRVSGQDFTQTRAASPVLIGAHSSATVPLRVAFPVAPGDHPESVQFAASDGAKTSLPVTRRTFIPADGGKMRTLITSTVGRAVGQVSTYEINVPAGRSSVTASFRTADASADNKYTFYLINPSGTVVSTDTTPKMVDGQPVATASVTAADPVAGTWQIDVELNLTTSGKEFSQMVYGDVVDP
jgi:hypothetical protein